METAVGCSLLREESKMDDTASTAMATANSLSDTFSGQLQTSVRTLASLMDELLEKQQNLITYLESINSRLGAEESIQKVHVTMLHTHQYYKKLLQIRKDIMDLHSKASKLKTRAQKLYVKQEEDARIRQTKLLQQEERERRLIAKPAKD